MNVSRSTDGGVTWSNGLQLSDFDGPDNTANNADDEGFVWPADVSVAPNGDVYVAYHSQPDLNANEVEVTRTNPNGTQGQIIIIFRSTDGGGGTADVITGDGGNLDLQPWGDVVPNIF